MRYYFVLVLALISSLALADMSPVIFNGTTAKWLPAALQTTGSLSVDGNGVMSVTSAGSGDVTSTSSVSVDGEAALFSGTGGKTIKRATTTGLGKFTAGVLSAATAGTDYQAPLSVTSSSVAASNGGSVSAATLTLNYADATYPGLLSPIDQSIGGVKTFLSSISAANLSGTNSGDVTLTAVGSSPNGNGASLSGQALTLQPADLTNPGVITAGAQTFGGAKSFSVAPTIDAYTSGSVAFYATGSILAQDAGFFSWDWTNHRLGILTSSPTTVLGFGAGAARTIGVERNTSTAGDNITIQAGGAVVGGTDAAGGTLQLRSGLSTGTGASSISFQTYTPATASSTADNSSSTKAVITGSGFFGIGTSGPVAPLSVAVGARTGAPSSVGSQMDIGGTSLQDTSTVATGVAAFFAGTRFASPTLSALNTGVNTTNAVNIRVNSGVNAGTNETITNSHALYLQGGAITGTVTNSYQLFINGPGTGPTNNYAMSITGNSGFGGVLDPEYPLAIAAAGVTSGTNEQFSLRSQRSAIVSGNMIGGITFKSNDTNLTAPGTNVAFIDALAEATHTASVLDTALSFFTTKTLTTSERMRISSSGSIGIGTTSPTNQLHTTGSVRFSNYGTGVANFDVNGTLASSASLPIVLGGTGQASANAAFNALSPNTTSGDITVYNGSANQRLAVGANTYVLTADNTVSGGIKWAASSGGGFTNSQVQVGAPNGFGSTNTNVRRWTTTNLNTGSDISYSDSSTLGGSFTINTTGVYSISVTDAATVASSDFYIKVNNTTTSATYANGVRAYAQIAVTGIPAVATWTGILTAGDVVREVGDTNLNTTAQQLGFSIVRVQ